MNEDRDLALVEPVEDGLTEADLHHACLIVCDRADDAAEARELLMMLGLLS